jgi:hypothetical protein
VKTVALVNTERKSMTGVRRLVTIGLFLALVAVGGCCTRWTSDTDGISFLVVRQQDAESLPTLTISNTSSVSIEVTGVEDMTIYIKKLDGWVRWGPCSRLVVYYTEKQTIPPGSSWEILPMFYTAKTCVLGDESVGTYMASIRYRISDSPRNAPPLTLYSDEFRVGDAENIEGLTVTIEQPGFSGFRLHNGSDQPIWFNPPCSRISDWYEGIPHIEAPYLLQRQIDADAWESFYPDEDRCAEELEPIRIEPGDTADIEAKVTSGGRDDFSPGRYRWKVVFVLDSNEDGKLTTTDTWRGLAHRQTFSPVFEHDGTSVTATP